MRRAVERRGRPPSPPLACPSAGPPPTLHQPGSPPPAKRRRVVSDVSLPPLAAAALPVAAQKSPPPADQPRLPDVDLRQPAARKPHPYVATLTVRPIPAGERRLVFLMMGQSNMSGRGRVEPADRVPVPGAWVLDGHGLWRPAAEPVTPSDGRGQGVGPGRTFAQAVTAALPGVTVLLVPAAVGSTGLRAWLPGGTLFDTAIARGRAVVADGAVMGGVLWMQGEDDAARDDQIGHYEQRLRVVFHRIRAELGPMPIMAGELGSYLQRLQECPKGRRTWRADRHFAEVNRCLRRVCGGIERAAVVPADGVTPTHDGLHLDARSQRLMGDRFAAAWLRLWEM
eukprot:TRINITY_DN8880_c0_g1_i2.p1 TRINITY_DN8880_c0_g1~~TRINITY_DN8880_c0_g1_i2.p1  ORF type:complete len:340 (+),score=80.95 TRINITY_DN8880_c0_g1_i2:278-1297(+)